MFPKIRLEGARAPPSRPEEECFCTLTTCGWDPNQGWVRPAVPHTARAPGGGQDTGF